MRFLGVNLRREILIMIKPNWNIFKTKFSENPQDNFEWFSYLLFCEEFNKPHGIFRYKNQSGIETNPIELTDGSIIGWQAKFYDDTLSNHKSDLLGTLQKSKRDYPGITHIILYTNSEWGQGRGGNDPQTKIDVEAEANDLGIDIEWRTASYFESPFVSIDHQIISSHFFSFKSVIDLIIEMQKHTDSILYEIQTNIVFDINTIKIDRTQVVDQLEDELSKKQILILSGVGGVGKTAVVKNIYEKYSDKVPFYIFKASEFEITNVNDLFPNFTLQNFIDVHKDDEEKIIVIDSAEKLLDTKNSDPFKQFLSTVIKNNWKIIFTTRENYLEDLNHQFIEIYKTTPFNINIQILDNLELKALSTHYNFELPRDSKLVDLLRNPFYLSEYLVGYKQGDMVKYLEFKEKLWNKNIKKSDTSREECFLKLAFERANKGQFWVKVDCQAKVLNELFRDGILGNETVGFFITHDIYEEWALGKIVNSEFITRENNQKFFESIGTSLPIRRAFRQFISEKLLIEDEYIHSFIESVVDDEEVRSFWRDEIIISVLLSDSSNNFFQYFKKKLIENDFFLLKKVSFLLRIACKESDLQTLKQWGIGTINDELQLSMIFTKPKGQGWQSFIQYIFEHRGEMGLENIEFILPVLHDWNSKFQEGDTTKLSGLLSVKYYQEIMKGSTYGHSEVLKKLLQVIASSAMEIKDELITIFDTVLENKYTEHNDPYADLTKMVLTQLDGVNISKSIPNKVLEIADLFWFKKPEPLGRFHSRLREEENYCIGNFQHDYYPASAYKTPIHWLLQYEQKATIDFILAFTNKTIQCYADFSSSSSIQTVKVFLNDGKVIEQYHSMNLWLMYRGNNGPNILQSIHMALEKFFLERAEKTDSETLEYWLLYLLENSKSSSITSVISSIVLAYPEKTFNVAAILFKTKEFIIYDLTRWSSENSAKSMYSIGAGLNWHNKMYEEERLKTCEDKHRKIALEHQLLNYQFFRTEETSESESEDRQKALWNILDHYYSELSQEDKDKTWRMFLARMDKRKMNPATEEHENGVLINFNPELDADLEEYSKKSQEHHTEQTKYLSLNLWASNKFKRDGDYKKYKEYENNPLLALERAKEILGFSIDEREYHSFFSYSTIVEVCAVLIRDHSALLATEDKEFCKDIILEVAHKWIHYNSGHTPLSDGTGIAVSLLPILINVFPKEEKEIKLLLFLFLFNDYLIENTRIYTHVMKVINEHMEGLYTAQSFLYGYLLLQPRYQTLYNSIRKEHYEQNLGAMDMETFIQRFIEENKLDLDHIIDNQITLDDITLSSIEKIDPSHLEVAFEILPYVPEGDDRKIVTNSIIKAISNNLLDRERKEKISYEIKFAFLKQFSYLVLKSNKSDIDQYFQPFLEKFGSSEIFSDLLNEIIYAEENLNEYESFWHIWDNLLYDKVVELSSKEGGCYIMDDVIKSYLFAKAPWTQNIKEWHSIKEGDKRFFKLISENIGHCPTVLYSIVKLLNSVGSFYLKDGLSWISNILKNNKNLLTDELDSDTIFYMEILIRKYIFMYHDEIKKTMKLKSEALIILEYMIKRGSASAYMWREMIY